MKLQIDSSSDHQSVGQKPQVDAEEDYNEGHEFADAMMQANMVSAQINDLDNVMESEDLQRVEEVLLKMREVYFKPSVRLPDEASKLYASPTTTFERDDRNKDSITNPRAIVDVLAPSSFLRSGLTEQSQCQILDKIIKLIIDHPQNNANVVREMMTQPIELLDMDHEYFERVNTQQVRLKDILQQFTLQNDIGLYNRTKIQLVNAQKQKNLNLIKKYGTKNSEEQDQTFDEEKMWDGQLVDFQMLLLYLGCKLSSQMRSQVTQKLSKLSHIVSEGYIFNRQHMEFLIQFVKQKQSKLFLMQEQLEESIKKIHKQNSSNNKIQLQEQIMIEKQQKLGCILQYVLNTIGSLTQNRRSIQSPQVFQPYMHTADDQNDQNYFYFQGSQSGMEYNQKGLSKEYAKKLNNWPFHKGYTLAIKFKLMRESGSTFDPNDLPVLFNCYSEGYGGFECYINPSYHVLYRVLPKNYNPPTIESNGIKVADIQPDQWNLLVIDHNKPYLARAQLIAILNDKQSLNFPMDYPKFDSNSKLTNLNVFKKMTGQLRYLTFFKDHFNNLKKFTSVLLQLKNIDELILKKENVLDNYFQDQSAQNHQSTNFIDKICFMYSPLRSSICQAFQCKQSKENQYKHQLDGEINLLFCYNSGVKLNKIENEFDLKQILPLLQLILGYEGKSPIKQMVNQFLKIVSTQQIEDQCFIESLFYLFVESLRKSSENIKKKVLVDIETINIFAEIRYQLQDEKQDKPKKKLHTTFFKGLIQTTDFWINQSLLKENSQTLNEQFWLLIKSIYSQNVIEYNEIFPVKTFLILMNEISCIYTKDFGGPVQSCCKYHQRTSKLLSHESLLRNGETKVSFRKAQIADQLQTDRDDFVLVMPQKGPQDLVKVESEDLFMRQMTELDDIRKSEPKVFQFLQIDANKDRDVDVQKLLEPITAVLETVLNSSFSQITSDNREVRVMPSEILDIIKHIAYSLSNSQSSPCFQIQMLRILRLVLLDAKNQEISHLFAQKFLNENGLQVLMYVCQITTTLDVKSLCIKIIDVLCTNHTGLIKMIRIDTDLISYLGNIILPKRIDYDIERIKKKRSDKLTMKKAIADLEMQKKRSHLIQIVDYHEVQETSDQQLDTDHKNQMQFQAKNIINYDEDDELMSCSGNCNQGTCSKCDLNNYMDYQQPIIVDATTMQVKLNSHEERQLDVLFGSSRNSDKSSARKEDQKMTNSEDRIVEDQFKLASQGVMMPPAPKSKVKPKFDFVGMDGSDSDEDSERNDQVHDKPNYEFTTSTKSFNPLQKKFGQINTTGGWGKKFVDDRDQIQSKSQLKNLEIFDLDMNNDQMLMQSQKLPGLAEYGFTQGEGQINVESNSKKFDNENTMAKSNLRLKDKTFNFGLAADYSESDEEQQEQSQQIDFYKTEQPMQNEELGPDLEEEFQAALDMKKKKRINPLAANSGNQQLQASQLSQIRRNKINEKNKVKMQKIKIGIHIPMEDDATAVNSKSEQITTTNPTPATQNLVTDSSDLQLNQESVAISKDIELDNQSDEFVLETPNLIAKKLKNQQQKSRQSDQLAKSEPMTKMKTQNNKQSMNQKKLQKPKNFNQGLALDIDAINEMYTYGGEQGKKKGEDDNDLEDFESGILELANQCIAAMNREKPTDPIDYEKYDNKGSKKSFEQKFASEVDEIPVNDDEDERPNYYRPNFNVPCTMRGIRKLSLGIDIKKDNKRKKLDLEIQDQFIEEEDIIENDDDEEDNFSNQNHPVEEVKKKRPPMLLGEVSDDEQENQDDINEEQEDVVDVQQRMEVDFEQKDHFIKDDNKKKMQIIKYDVMTDPDESVNNESNQNIRQNARSTLSIKQPGVGSLQLHIAQSQKSEFNENITCNNSKFEKLESFGEFSENLRQDNRSHFKPAQIVEEEVEDEEDIQDKLFLEEFDNEQTTLELSNLYTSCLEWILNRPVSSLNSQLMIDDYDKIQFPAALELLMNLVGQSNNLLQQRALLDFYMLSQWDSQNGHVLLFHQKFHTWLLDLLMTYQQYTDEQDESYRAVYDMGCKLHTLLLTNSCLNPEVEAFKKLNMVARYPLTIQLEKRVTAEKLSRVLLIDLIKYLQQNCDQLSLQLHNDLPQMEDFEDLKVQESLMAGWRNLTHLFQLCEEMIYTSNYLQDQDEQKQDAGEQSPDEKNQKNINPNASMLEWLKSSGNLLYFEQKIELNCSEIVWAEWELIESIFSSFETFYKNLDLIDNETSNLENLANQSQLISQQQYQVSYQMVQEKVYDSMQKYHNTSKFDQDIQLLMRECLVGNQITPRDNTAIENTKHQQQQQPSDDNHPETSSKFSLGKMASNNFKNIKLQFQNKPQERVISQQSQLNQQSKHCLIDSMINIICTALIEGNTKELIQSWLRKLEKFLKYIMIMGETLELNSQKSVQDQQFIESASKKFCNILTFGFAFLFNKIHSTNQQQSKYGPMQSSNGKLQIGAVNKMTQNPSTSRSSSPKDYQAINRMFALTLKNLVIFLVNIIDFKDKNQQQAQDELQTSAVENFFHKILIYKFSDEQQSQLITLDDIKRFKATNFEDFPEYFSHEEWKVTFFHNEEINMILRSQLNQTLIDDAFLQRRQTFGQGINEMNYRSEKTKEDIQKKINADTNMKISKLTQFAYQDTLNQNMQILVQNIYFKQKYDSLADSLYLNRGLWQSYGAKFYKVCSNGYCGLGVKAFMKERNHQAEKHYNGFKFIKNQAIEEKLFKSLHKENFNLQEHPKQNSVDQDGKKQQLFKFFDKGLNKNEMKKNQGLYVNLVKKVAIGDDHPNISELMTVDCVIMKQFYQLRGTLVLTNQALFFVYMDQLTDENTGMDIKNHDSLFFFRKQSNFKKLYKRIDLDSIKDLQRRRFIGIKNCLEVYLIDNSSYLMKFSTTEDRDNFAKKLLKMRGINCKNLRFYDSLDPKKIIKKRELTDRWRQWRISNFQYIMSINYYGGRSQNDLSQYPVLPWIFKNYKQEDAGQKMNHETINQYYSRGQPPPEIFRDLSKNMQLLGSAERQAEFKKKYEDIDGFEDMDDRFHCGSHYSNPGIVLHFLARLSPYIDAIVELQGMNHDNPDRIFHSLHDSFSNALNDHSDVREITPEFFYLPEMFLNKNNINFGRRADRQEVNDIQLPYWCNNNPYKFVAGVREALESNYVSQGISKWLDYIFGYKQLGSDAERSLNTYSAVTYEDRIDLEKKFETEPDMAESYKLQMYNYGQTPSNILSFKQKEHPSKKYKEEVYKQNLVCDQYVNLKVYRPVNKKKNSTDNNKALVMKQILHGKLPMISRKAIVKAQFINEGLIAAARVDGKMRFYMWVNQANELNPMTPFTCGKEKKKLFEYSLSQSILQNDITLPNLNKPMVILNRGKFVLCGGHFDGQICLSITQDHQSEKVQGNIIKNQFNRSSILNSQQQNQEQNQIICHFIEAHSSTCTVISSTIDDPNKIISKSQQNAGIIQNDICIVISGSKFGDLIIWKFIPEANLTPSQMLQKQKHFYDHDGPVTSIFIHQDMQFFSSCSQDGTANLYSLPRLELLRCFQHPNLNPLSAVILSNQPLVSISMFSSVDHEWQSFSINGQHLNALEPENARVYHEECSHIIAPKVIQNSHFMERLIYGTENGFMVIRDLPFMNTLKRINISTANIIQPVLSFIVSKDRRFLLVGCGEGGLTVITEPFSQQNQNNPQATRAGQLTTISNQSNQTSFSQSYSGYQSKSQFQGSQTQNQNATGQNGGGGQAASQMQQSDIQSEIFNQSIITDGKEKYDRSNQKQSGTQMRLINHQVGQMSSSRTGKIQVINQEKNLVISSFQGLNNRGYINIEALHQNKKSRSKIESQSKTHEQAEQNYRAKLNQGFYDKNCPYGIGGAEPFVLRHSNLTNQNKISHNLHNSAGRHQTKEQQMIPQFLKQPQSTMIPAMMNAAGTGLAHLEKPLSSIKIQNLQNQRQSTTSNTSRKLSMGSAKRQYSSSGKQQSDIYRVDYD